MLGMGMDLPLLAWLETYTFPVEARFQDPDFARVVYRAYWGAWRCRSAKDRRIRASP